MSDTKLWINKIPEKELFYEFIKTGFFPPLLAQILINKDIKDVKIAYSFLYPRISDFYDPFKLPDIISAVKRLEKAILNHEKIGIYGDSDVDGVVGTFILYDFLKNFFSHIEVLIPSKEKEGYGFHAKFLPYFKKKGVSLIITVDVGISASETVNQAKAMGIDVIITDHHEVVSPPETIIVCPKFLPEDSPLYPLCGAGVVFTLIRALRTYLYHRGYFKNLLPSLRKYLEPLCIATLADVVPIQGENRIITYFGFRDLNNPSFPAIKVLLENANLKYGLTEEDLYFKVIPKLNAGGRLGKPEIVFKFLASETEEEAQKYFSELSRLNQERQEKELEFFQLLENSVPDKVEEEKFLMLITENIPRGLLGLLANRFRKIYNLPVLVISLEDEIGIGSVRSPQNIDFFEIMRNCEDLLIQYGGHKYALGFTMHKENLEKLRERLNNLLSKCETLKKPVLYIDAVASLSELFNEEVISAFEKFPPYGEKHFPPLIALKDFIVKDVCILKEKHSKLFLKNGSYEISAICFNKILGKDLKFIAGTPFINPYTKTLEIKVEDAK